MKLIDGVIHHEPWESAMAYFTPKTYTASQSTSSSHRLGKLLVDSIRVTVAILADDTLDCNYKLGRLILPKELKHTCSILDMVIADLRRYSPTSTALQSALRLRSAWVELSRMQQQLILKLRYPLLSPTKQVILDSLTSLLNALRD